MQPDRHSTTGAHRIYIRPSFDGSGQQRLSPRGPLFDAFHGEKLIVDASPQPFADGCRILQGLGLSGKCELWDFEKRFARMTSTIETMAGLTVVEGHRRPRFEVWRPFPVRGEELQAGGQHEGRTDISQAEKAINPDPADDLPLFAAAIAVETRKNRIADRLDCAWTVTTVAGTIDWPTTGRDQRPTADRKSEAGSPAHHWRRR